MYEWDMCDVRVCEFAFVCRLRNSSPLAFGGFNRKHSTTLMAMCLCGTVPISHAPYHPVNDDETFQNMKSITEGKKGEEYPVFFHSSERNKRNREMRTDLC